MPHESEALHLEEVEAAAITESLARGASRERLLEILLEVRDVKGGLGISEQGLLRVAERLRLFPSEAYEVATAFPAVNYMASVPYALHACGDLVCSLLHGGGSGHGVCRNRCDGARSAPNPRSFSAYRFAGGYQILDRLSRDLQEVPRLMESIATYRAIGRAGVGFPVVEKWRQVMRRGAVPVVIVNGDEGELAVFKDRFILENDPHGVIEAALVAARVTGADKIFFYIRDDYKPIHVILRKAIADVVSAGLASGIAIELRRSGGAYICGEETALIASLEGRPPRPAERPPFPTTRGYFGRPTLVHNVETFFRLRSVWGSAPEPDLPVSDLLAAEVTLFSVSGRVRNPGPKPVRGLSRLIDLVDIAGGLTEGVELGGMVVGGSSGTLLPAADCRRPLDELLSGRLRLGTGGIVVFGTGDDMRGVASKMAGYLARESCGQCGPCRVGTAKAAQALNAPGRLDVPLINDLSVVMSEASICALGRNAGRFLGRLPSLLETCDS